LRLAQTTGVGPETARRLLAAFGLPQNIFSASLPELQKVVSDRIARALSSPSTAEESERIARTVAWAAQPGNRVLTLADADYPPSLLDIADPPILLYAKGRAELLSRPSMAVVGSRNATAQGISNAEKFSEALAHAGLTIISGMALGIDTAAHQGGLAAKSAGGSTIAVIGTGADIRLSRTQPRPCPSDRESRLHRQRISAWRAGDRIQLPSSQSDHQRSGARRTGDRSRIAIGFVDHRTYGSRTGARRICDPRLDSFAAVEGLPSTDQARCQAGRIGTGHS
jgi:hypothetical protein